MEESVGFVQSGEGRVVVVHEMLLYISLAEGEEEAERAVFFDVENGYPVALGNIPDSLAGEEFAG